MRHIEDFFTTYPTAVWNKNVEELLNLYDPKVSSFDMWDQGFYSGLEAWEPELKSWLENLKEEKVQVVFDGLEIYQSDAIGFAYGMITFRAIDEAGNMLRGMRNRITIGFKHSEDEWKVVHQHISAPIQSRDLKAILQI